MIIHLPLPAAHGLCGDGGGGRGGGGECGGGEKCFLAPSNLKHLDLSEAAKRMWLKQIKIIAGSKLTHKCIPSGSSISFSSSPPPPSSLPPTSP